MTYIDKLKKEHPSRVVGSEPERQFGLLCPNHYDYTSWEEDDSFCNGHTCEECWNREIPESTEIEKEKEPMDYEKEIEKKNQEIADMKKEIERLKTYVTVKKGADDCATFLKVFIDTGFTREEAFQILLTGMKTGIKK
jgi:DNA repair exonuclease SbcCD ATPase subunit